jgi:predicted DNA-binding protein YlxM (UPF0122 family)
MSVKELAEKYNVKRTVISNIKNGNNWSHITVDGFSHDNSINRSATLTDDEVRDVKNMLINGFTHNQILQHFNVSESYISKIHRGIVRSDVVVEGFEASKRKHKKLDEEKVGEIKRLLKTKDLQKTEIASMYGVSSQAIYDIDKGRRWSKVKI